MAETKAFMSWRDFYAKRRFSVLLVVLVALLAGPPMLIGFGMSSEWFELLMLLLVLAALLSFCVVRAERVFALLFGIPTMVFTLGGFALYGETSSIFVFCSHVCAAIFLFGMAALIVRLLFGSQTIDFDSFLGAICGYVFLGLGWAMLYSLIERLHTGSFAVNPGLLTPAEANVLPTDVLVYYSFVTLTTLGYGDVVPTSHAAQTLAWMEAITGQFYLAVIVATLVSILVAKGPSPHPESPTEGSDSP